MRKTATALSAITLLAWLAYHAVGSRYDGSAKSPTNIPLIGEKLSELRFAGPARFRGFEHPHGGSTFTVTGTATPDSVRRFCDGAKVSLSQNGTNIQDRDAILEYLQNHDISLPDSNAEDPTEVLFGFGGRFHKLYGVYNPDTQRFAISLQFDGSK